jgi:hypothetical protein
VERFREIVWVFQGASRKPDQIGTRGGERAVKELNAEKRVSGLISNNFFVEGFVNQGSWSCDESAMKPIQIGGASRLRGFQIGGFIWEGRNEADHLWGHRPATSFTSTSLLA